MSKVTPQGLSRRNLQKERQQKGKDFETEIRRSWRQVPKTWRYKLEGGGTKPGDEIVLTEEINILAEAKRTAGQKFELSFLTQGEFKGLLDFDEIISRNYGLVFVSFLNDSKKIDETFAFRLSTALEYMKKNNRAYIKLEEFRKGDSVSLNGVPCVSMPVTDFKGHRSYDLKGVVTLCKYL